MSIYSSGRRRRKLSRSHLGHLKLSAYEDSSALVVTIHEVRGLPRRDSGAQDTYVKLYIIPDPDKLTKQKTRASKEKDPKFDESFSWILSQGDHEKRLFISVWAKDSLAKHFMIGCMSFQMADVIGLDKGIHGWFQLLDEERGLTENSAVPATVTKTEHVDSSVVRKLAVTLVRGAEGYGFSVSGFNPVSVTKVHPGLPANEAGIKVNDIVLEVEGIDVTRASGQVVVDLIRKYPCQINLLLKRNAGNQVSRSSVSTYNVASLTQPEIETLPLSTRMRHSTLNLATSRDAALVRRNLFHMQQQHSPGLSPDYPSQDSSEFSQTRTSRNSLVQHLPDGSGSGRKDSPMKVGDRPTTSSSALQPTSSTLASVRGSRQAHTQTSFHSDAATGIGSGYSSRQHQHCRGSCTDIYHEPSSHQLLAHVARQRSSEFLGGHDDVFLTAHIPRGNSPSMSPPSGGTFHTGSSVMRRSMFGPSHQSQSTYDSAYESIRNSPIPQGWHYSATQGCDAGVQPLAVTGRDIDRRYRGVACSPTGNVQLTSARRVFSDERLPLHLVYGKKLSDNDSALGGSASDCTLSPPPTSPLHRPITVDWQSLDMREQKRQKAIHKLLRFECDYELRLQSGIEVFLNPLRKSYILHVTQHSRIFMNLEEIYELTQDICPVLRSRQQDFSDSAPLPHYIPSFADIYMIRLRPLQHQYEKYLQLFEPVGPELSLAFTNTAFANFIQSAMESSTVQQTIHNFVLLPREYIPRLLTQLLLISSLTPTSHEDQKPLTHVIEGLLSCCTDKELVSRYRKNRDTIAALKLRVGFSHHVEKLTIDAPGRMLLEEGEVTLVERKWRRNKKACLLLFNDILLVALRDGVIYSVIESPFTLHRMTVQEVGGAEGTDLQLSHDDTGVVKVIRCMSHAAREKWVCILEQYSHSVIRASRSGSPDKKVQDMRSRRLTSPGSIDLAAATSLAHKFESSEESSTVVESPVSGEGGRVSKTSSDKKKRHGLFGIGKSATVKGKSGPELKNSVYPSTPQPSGPPNPFDGVSPRLIRQWSMSFDAVLESSVGRRMFHDYLRSECSQENIQFWEACERFKLVFADDLSAEAKVIYNEFVQKNADKQVNLNHETFEKVESKMLTPAPGLFDEAQHFIYQLMARDSYPRFIKTQHFQEALRRAERSSR